jgi:hypothetical protein
MLEDTGHKSEHGFTLYRRSDTGEVAPFLNNPPHPIPVGAMWWCTWLTRLGYKRSEEYPDEAAKPSRYFPDAKGRILAVMTPGGTWIIDSRASNCTKPTDNKHRCWVRHGEPPNVTVDKNGETCEAGAGSIIAGSYHGFLRSGELTT